MLYTDLAHARAEIKAADTDKTFDDYVVAAIQHVSARIDAIVGYEFAPRIGTRLYDALGDHIDDTRRLLHLGAPLLAATEVIDGEGTPLVAATDYGLVGLDLGSGDTPYEGIRLVDTGASWSDYADDWLNAISVSGIWGFHRQYASAWENSGDAVANAGGISASVTAITVSDVDGLDACAWTPRFSPGQLIQIGTEWLTVEAADAVTNILTVKRGQRGSTAAVHASATPITIWRPDALIQRATNRWAAFLYSRRGVFEQVTYDGLSTKKFPPDMPDEVRNILIPFLLALDEPFEVV